MDILNDKEFYNDEGEYGKYVSHQRSGRQIRRLL